TLTVAGEFVSNVAELAGDTVDCFVGKIFGFNATSTSEDFYEAMANLFILRAGSFAIRIEPGEQRIKRFLRQDPVFIHQVLTYTNWTDFCSEGARDSTGFPSESV